MWFLGLAYLTPIVLLSRADVKDTVKVIRGVLFANSRLFNESLTLKTKTISQFCMSVGYDGFRTSVSGRIDSSVLSLFLLRCSFSLALSLFLLPSISLSFLFSPSFLPSFLPSLSCNKFVGRRTQNKNPCYAVTVRILCSWDLVRICIRANYLSLVRDLPSSNMLEAAISVSLFCSTSQARSCALWMPRYVASITFTCSYFLTPFNLLVSSFSVEGSKRIKEGRKEGDDDTFQLKPLFLGLIRLFCSVEMCSWTIRKRPYLANKALKYISHFRWVISFSAEIPSEHQDIEFLFSAKSPFFTHAPLRLPVRGFWEPHNISNLFYQLINFLIFLIQSNNYTFYHIVSIVVHGLSHCFYCSTQSNLFYCGIRCMVLLLL